KPAENWEHALLSGNGTMGIMTIGEPYKETLIVSHSSLFRPNKIPDHYIDQAKRLPQIRQLLLDGQYKEASQVITDMREECDYTGAHRDPFITGFDLSIAQTNGTPTRYQRKVNFETAETITEWTDENGYFIRKAFVSRADSIIAVSLKSGGKINCSIAFEQRNQLDEKGLKVQPVGFSSMSSDVENGWMVFRARYENENIYNPYQGYEGTGRVICRGGKQTVEGSRIVITNADEVTVLLKIAPVKKGEATIVPALQAFINSKSNNYNELASRNLIVHNALFSKVRLNLNAAQSDLALSTDALIKKSDDAQTLPLAMIERAFEAGRYNIICSTGTNPPNLLGLWSGTWSAPWAGSYTLNGNLQTAIAFILAGNTPSLMQSYFDLNASRMDGYRRNARELFGCRGFNVPAQMTVSPLHTDFSGFFLHNCWVGGTGWTAWQYFDYYRYTGDVEFLRNTAYPLMKEAAAFYEDFLTLGKDGKYLFSPSYSPENAPNTDIGGNAATINATMDVAITKQLLRSCITAAKILQQDEQLVTIWQDMLPKMPNYEVSEDGYFREWLWHGLAENNRHRHASHLYPLYDEMPPEIIYNETLRKAIEKSIDARYDFRKKASGMAFGMVQAALAAAHIGNASQTEYAINVLARGYWTTGMGSYHDEKGCFNMDISGGFPYLVSQALTYSEPGYLKLFPALPATWKEGSIQGLLLRGNVVLNLSWDEGNVEVSLLSATSGSMKIELNGKIHTVQLTKDKPVLYKLL
ncbi:MAG: glycoside hydrolase N-terminal domain-containing protein, partial [Bacteroidales bacterium]|nr:glycoside hydrolase N-terminal domain-containing protein [Bacteroidales bacterium]